MKVSYRPRSGVKSQGNQAGDGGASDGSSAAENLAILGHEIRNPLGALNYALQAWPTSIGDSQLKQDLLQIMRRQVNQLNRLCNDMLDSGKLARGDLAIRRDTVDLRRVVQCACEELRPVVEHLGHKIKVTLGDMPLKLIGDEARLTQVFANILHNAAKFTQPSGRIEIDIESRAGMAIVRLRDNGCGMDEGSIRRLFSGASDVPYCSEGGGDGLGIGLRLAKTIVGLHGGEIAAISEGRGCGCTFEICLPLMEEIAPADKNTESPIGTDFSKRGFRVPRYRVVVVDDDRSMGFLISRLLEKLNQSVSVVGDGEVALQKILELRPHVVFLDLNLRGISGFDIARQIRSHVDLVGVVVIALSGASGEASRKVAAESGIDHYLVKPASLDDLAEAIFRVGE